MITINNKEYNLNFDTQYSPRGRPFRLSGIAKDLSGPENDPWRQKNWIYTFRFLDAPSEYIHFYFNQYETNTGYTITGTIVDEQEIPQ